MGSSQKIQLLGFLDGGAHDRLLVVFPKAAVETLIPSQLELSNTEVIINFPSFISHPRLIKRHLAKGGPPPPPPSYPESSWDNEASASYRASIHPPAASGPRQFAPPVDLLTGYDSLDDF